MPDLWRAALAGRRRKAVVIAAAVAAGLLAGGVAVALTSGSQAASGETTVDGATNAVLYPAGHRALAPDFTGTTLTGAPLRFASYRGRVVVLNFWGSWCVPCRSEGPTLAVLSEKYRSSGVSFLGVDVGDTPANAEAFERGVGITYPSVNDPGYAVAQDFGRAVPINATPTTVVVDKTGHVAGAIFGPVTYQVLSTMLHDVGVTS